MSIERIKYPGFEVMVEKYIAQGKPVVFTGLFENSGPFNWTPSLLKERYGQVQVDVGYSRSGKFNLNSKNREMTIDEYIDNRLSDDRYYLQQVPVSDYFPGLLKEVPLEEILGPDIDNSSNIWVSGQNSSTPLHFDDENNLFFQCYGQKKFLLYDSKQAEYLYPFEKGDARHMSRVDIFKPNLKKYPLFRKAELIDEIIISAGEVLLMPTGTWHQVTGLSTSISLNIWFRSFDFQMTLPAYTMEMPDNYLDLADIITSLTTSKFKDVWGIVNEFHAQKMYYESCVCHLALLEREVHELLVPGEFDEGNLKKSIKLCKSNPAQKLDSETRDLVLERFNLGIRLLKQKNRDCTADQSASWSDSVRRIMLKIEELR